MEYALRLTGVDEENKPFPSLNPYYNGICSPTLRGMKRCAYGRVLILIIMEYALRQGWGVVERNAVRVLILIIMEYALRQVGSVANRIASAVLILIIMEYALRHREWVVMLRRLNSLNPYYNGICSPTYRG